MKLSGVVFGRLNERLPPPSDDEVYPPVAARILDSSQNDHDIATECAVWKSMATRGLEGDNGRRTAETRIHGRDPASMICSARQTPMDFMTMPSGFDLRLQPSC
jgi:hypothetical protein